MKTILFFLLMNANVKDTCTDKYLKLVFNPAKPENYVFVPVMRNGERKILVTTNLTLYNFVRKHQPDKSDTALYVSYIIDTYHNSYLTLNGPLNVRASVFDLIDSTNLYKDKYKGKFAHFYEKYTQLNPQGTARFPKLGRETKGQEYYIFQVLFEGNKRIMYNDGVFYLKSFNCEKMAFE
jgi:hypothetical protein